MGFAIPDPTLRRRWRVRSLAQLGVWQVWRDGAWHADCGRWETAMYLATGDRWYRRWWIS